MIQRHPTQPALASGAIQYGVPTKVALWNQSQYDIFTTPHGAIGREQHVCGFQVPVHPSLMSNKVHLPGQSAVFRHKAR